MEAVQLSCTVVHEGSQFSESTLGFLIFFKCNAILCGQQPVRQGRFEWKEVLRAMHAPLPHSKDCPLALPPPNEVHHADILTEV